MELYRQALGLFDKAIAHRRYIHENAEDGISTPNTLAYISSVLDTLGIRHERCGCGIVAYVGRGEREIILRCDTDGLPFPEASGESFSSKTSSSHSCGHDMHCAMLLCAAELLKMHEDEIGGTVKLMFQPGEECFRGCADMLAHSLLDGRQEGALALHVGAGNIPVGGVMYNSSSVMMNSVYGFRIEIFGRPGHGAYPHKTVDPINIACNIYTALSHLTSHETDPAHSCVCTVGKLSSGDAPNTIPETAVMEGTLRTNDEQTRTHMIKRIHEVANGICSTYGGKCRISTLADVPTLKCNEELTDLAVDCCKSLGTELTFFLDVTSSASDDLAHLAQLIPTTYIYLTAGFEGHPYLAHDPRVRFNEDVLPLGSSLYAAFALNYFNRFPRRVK